MCKGLADKTLHNEVPSRQIPARVPKVCQSLLRLLQFVNTGTTDTKCVHVRTFCLQWFDTDGWC